MRRLNFVIGFVFVSILGVLFHFAFDFFNLQLLKIFFPQNESIFEHLKTLIIPTIIYMMFDIIYSKSKENIFSSYTGGLIVASIFMISGYYTYSGIIGYNIDWVNIFIFFICVFIIFYYRYKKITLFEGSNSVIALIIYLVLIEVFTFYPINISLFNELG